MADWLHCNICFRQPGDGVGFSLTNCGHVYCDKCVKTGEILLTFENNTNKYIGFERRNKNIILLCHKSRNCIEALEHTILHVAIYTSNPAKICHDMSNYSYENVMYVQSQIMTIWWVVSIIGCNISWKRLCSTVNEIMKNPQTELHIH